MKTLTILLLSMLFLSIPISLIGKDNSATCLFFIKDSDSIVGAETCVWKFAKQRMIHKFPQISRYIQDLATPEKINYQKTPIISNGIECFGLTKGSDMSIYIYLSGDTEEDIDSLCHEFGHYIALYLGKLSIITERLFWEIQEFVEYNRHWEMSKVY